MQRLSPQFAELEAAMDARRLELQTTSDGLVPEQVLVLETVGSVEQFLTAVRNINGMEWLGEIEREDIAPDDDFFRSEEDRDSPLTGRVFLVTTNQGALTELLLLWKHYEENPNGRWIRGRAAWRNLFRQLQSIRTWGVRDRLIESGALDFWRVWIETSDNPVRAEIELWFQPSELRRAQAQARLVGLLSQIGSRVLDQAVVPPIAYHGVLAEIPGSAVREIVAHPDTQLVMSQDVMFFRPVGQMMAPAPEDEPIAGAPPTSDAPLALGPPVVALLDGLPLQNHVRLANRLIVDDPDNFEAAYLAEERNHGTAMASLIVHGELDTESEAAHRLLYVRPVLKPDPRDRDQPRVERAPEDVLLVDLIRRAVRRLFEDAAGEPAAAPSVRIINLALGDQARLFYDSVSPLARLLDWLAWEYRHRALFVVSAGNHGANIELEIAKDSVASLSPLDRDAAVLRAILKDVRNRRLLSPAEAVNAITVGALHADSSTADNLGPRLDVFSSRELPSPVSAVGFGYRRSIKPDVLLPGGRQLYQEGYGTGENAEFRVSRISQAPGCRVAAPSTRPGVASEERYARGTSNATALATRAAAQLHGVVVSLRDEPGGELLNDRYVPVLLKALLVHGARWGRSGQELARLLDRLRVAGRAREHVARFIGYGSVDLATASTCTDQRATIIGCGSIGTDQASLFVVPLPASLNARRCMRRLTITLAWLTPIAPAHRAYRRSQVWFQPPLGDLLVKRQDVDGRGVLRGTVQHEVLEGQNAAPYAADAALQIQVNCRATTDQPVTEIPYALLVTLEVAEAEQIPIYDEIRSRIRPVVRVPIS